MSKVLLIAYCHYDVPPMRKLVRTENNFLLGQILENRVIEQQVLEASIGRSQGDINSAIGRSDRGYLIFRKYFQDLNKYMDRV